MGRALRPGEEVTWNISQGETRAIKRTVQRGEGDDVAASTDHPEHVVESRKRAAHKRSALKKT